MPSATNYRYADCASCLRSAKASGHTPTPTPTGDYPPRASHFHGGQRRKRHETRPDHILYFPKSTHLRDSRYCPGCPASVPLRHTIASSAQAPQHSHNGVTVCRIRLHMASAYRGLPSSCFALPWRAAVGQGAKQDLTPYFPRTRPALFFSFGKETADFPVCWQISWRCRQDGPIWTSRRGIWTRPGIFQRSSLVWMTMSRCSSWSGECYASPYRMRPIDFFFESANRFAGLDGCRTRQAARTDSTCLCRISQVGVGQGKYFAAHVSIVADLSSNENQLKQEWL